MIKPDLSNWDYSEDLELMLFSIQRIEEMLFDHTIDSYKVSVMNTHSLCRELLDIVTELKNGFILPGAVNPIIEELIWSLENDLVAQSVLNNKHEEFIKSLKNIPKLTKNNYNEHINRVESEAHTLAIIFNNNYLKKSKELIKELINSNKKQDLNNILNSFISELTNIGYSKQYIYQKNRQTFFDPKKKVESSDFISFLDSFDLKPVSFKVIFKIDSEFYKLKNEIEKELNDIKISSEAPEINSKGRFVRAFIKTNKKFPYFLEISNIKVLDYYRARDLGEILLNLISDVVAYNYHKSKISWDKRVLCISQKNFEFVTEPPISLIKKIKDHDNLEEAFSSGLNLFKTGFSIENSLNLHSCSLESKTPEIQLMNLWTALETLLPPPNQDLSLRITNFTGNIVPILGRNYIKKLIGSLLDNLKINLSKGEFNQIKSLFPDEISDFEMCSQLLCIKKDCEPMRDELYKYLLENPLLKFRVYSLMNQLKDAKVIHGTIELHTKRVDWHLQRIYRARNLITHKGSKVNNISSLLENMFQYYYTVIDTLFEASKNNNLDFSSLNATFNIIIKEHNAHIKMLKGRNEEKCQMNNYFEYLYGEIKIDSSSK